MKKQLLFPLQKLMSGLIVTLAFCFMALTQTAQATNFGTPVPSSYFSSTFYDNNNVATGLIGSIGLEGKMPATGWAYIQPTSRTDFDWAPIDNQVAAMQRLGLTSFVYLIGGGAPGWAVANHSTGTGGTNTITGQWVSYLQPDNMADLTNFVGALLTRYPNIHLIYNYCEPQNEPMPIADAVAEDTALVAYVHANFHNVLIGSPTIQGQDSPLNHSGNWYNDFWAAGGPTTNYDVILYHGYPSFTAPGNTVEKAMSRRASILPLLTAFGLTQPIWDEESSWGSDSSASTAGTDVSAFIVQDFLMHWSVGDSVFCWYGASNLGWGTLAAAGNTGAMTAAGNAYLQARQWMIGSSLVSPGITLTGVIRSGTWTEATGSSAISVWTSDGSTPTYTVPTHTPPYTQYRTVTGTIVPITGGTVTLSGKPIWIETGTGLYPPNITSALSANGAVGSAFSYSITANNSPASYSASGLPLGLSVNTSTGAITGSPTTPGIYSTAISATNTSGTGTLTLIINIFGTIPSPWAHGDIGTPTPAGGTASAAGNIFQVTGGSGGTGTADAFHFVYQPVNGDCSITVQAISKTNGNTGCFVEIRESLAAGSTYVGIRLYSSSNAGSISRTTTGGTGTAVLIGSASVPRYIRVTRVGNVFTPAYSGDNYHWTSGTPITISMASNVYVGMGTSSSTSGVLETDTFNNATVTQSFPSPWTHADVGTAAPAGTASYTSGVFTVSGGNGGTATADAFQFVSQPVSGDCSIVARVASKTNGNTAAFVEIRESLAAGSTYAGIRLYSSSNVGILYRTTTGGSAASAFIAPATVPRYIRMTRSGSTFTPAYSSDGVTWNSGTPVTITMGTSCYVGMGTSTSTAGTLETDTFDNVTATP